jgi:hypothetical protein
VLIAEVSVVGVMSTFVFPLTSVPFVILTVPGATVVIADAFVIDPAIAAFLK